MNRSLPIATAFCAAEIPLWAVLSFWIDGNSKITRENGTYSDPKPNAFSLPAASVPDPYPHVGTSRPCPGSTAACRESCYVKGLAKHAPEIYARYQSNADALEVVLSDAQLGLAAAHKLAAWITEHAPHGFRWHVSGDVQSYAHAQWIRAVCWLASDVPFWIYTRTLDVVETLSRAPNLAVNVSADVDNFADAKRVALATRTRLCYLTINGELPDLPPGSVIFPDYALRGRDLAVPTDAPWWQSLTHDQRAMACPTDFFGQSEAHRCGPCRKCF